MKRNINVCLPGDVYRFCLVLISTLLLLIIIPAESAYADEDISLDTINGEVEINLGNFPNEEFRNYVSRYDLDGDGWLYGSELSEVTEINYCPESAREGIKGIEFFTELKKLTCNTANIPSIDLSNNTQLEYLNISECGLKSLDLSQCKQLKYLSLFENILTSLDLSNNTQLEELRISNCGLELLNISQCKDLKYLYCYDNKLTSLDLRNNTILESLYCYSNKITTIDISECRSLKKFDCHDNSIRYLDISNCSNMKSLVDSVQGEDLDTYYRYKSGEWLFAYDKTVVVNPPLPSTVTPTKTPTKTPTNASSVSIKLNHDFIIIICGSKLSLKATVKGTQNKVTWNSSDKNKATIDSSGCILAKQAGVVTIIASVAGKSTTCRVQVLFKDVTDIKDFWYAPTNYLSEAGIVKGYDNQTLFKPANECSRAQMVTFLWRLEGQPKPSTTTTDFKDIKTSDYFYKPVLWAVEKGITTGVSKERFDPQGICTRAQTVTFLWRMAGKPVPKTKTCKFPDVKSKDYFYKATIWASEMKIVAGLSDGTFNPKGKCLRRQMVTFLYKYDKYINGKG